LKPEPTRTEGPHFKYDTRNLFVISGCFKDRPRNACSEAREAGAVESVSAASHILQREIPDTIEESFDDEDDDAELAAR
jgi:hypothetical protein